MQQPGFLRANFIKLIQTTFVRQVFTLATGTAAAQILPIAATPLFTRLFSPHDFGIFAIFTAVTALVAVMVTGRYELAILLPDEDKSAANIVFISLIISVAITSILSIVNVTLHLIPIAGVTAETKLILALAPVSILLTGAFQTLNYWANRRCKYGLLAASRTIQAIGMVVSTIAYGLAHLDSMSLILGAITGQCLGVFVLYCGNRTELYHYYYSISVTSLITQARKYIHFPKFLVVAHSINTAASSLPVFLLSALFNASISGHFSLSNRTIRLPMSIIGGAVGDVFRQRAAKEFSTNGNCKALFCSTLAILTAIGVLPFVVLFFISPWLFDFVFGKEWHTAGIYAQAMVPLFFAQFISSPLSNMYIVAQKQRLDLAFQLALITLTASSIVTAYTISRDPYVTVVAFAASYTVVYLANLVITYKFAKGDW